MIAPLTKQSRWLRQLKQTSDYVVLFKVIITRHRGSLYIAGMRRKLDTALI